MLGVLPTQKDNSTGFVFSCMFHFPWNHDIGWFNFKQKPVGQGENQQVLGDTDSSIKTLGCDLLLCYPGLASGTQVVCECAAACKDRDQNRV